MAREIQVDMHKVRNCIITCKSPALLYVYGYSRQRIFLPVGSFALPGPQIPHAYTYTHSKNKKIFAEIKKIWKNEINVNILMKWF